MTSFSETTKNSAVAAGESDVSGHGLPGESNRAPLSPKDRTRKHRANLEAQDRCRVEVAIDRPLVETVREITHKPMWGSIQKPLRSMRRNTAHSSPKAGGSKTSVRA